MFVKANTFIICLLLISILSAAQHPGNKSRPITNGKSQAITLDLLAPVGNFSDTHFPGLALSYARSVHRFVPLKSASRKAIGFTWNAGTAYYFGRKETVSGYSYPYPGYLFFHGYAGLVYNRGKKIQLQITAGPGLGLYDHDTRFNIGGQMSGVYCISRRISLGPSLLWMKENISRPLWSAGIKTAWVF